MFLYTILLLVSAVCTCADETVLPPQEKPEEFAHQEGCYVRGLNKVIPYGDFYMKNPCGKIICRSTNETQVFKCDEVEVDETGRCKVISNRDADYPACCPVVMCSTFPPPYAHY